MLEGVESPTSTVLVEEHPLSDAGSIPRRPGPGGDRLNPQQREFARQYVFLGGNGAAAARLAGYTAPEKASWRLGLNGAVQREVKRLSIVHIEAKLPQLIAAAIKIIENEALDPRARVQAIFGLMDRAGMRPKSDAPSLQVNVQVNGAAAQGVIGEVWQRRIERTGVTVSDIAADMSDSGVLLEHHSAESAADAPATGWGGDAAAGSPPGTSFIPTGSDEHEPENASSIFDDGED